MSLFLLCRGFGVTYEGLKPGWTTARAASSPRFGVTYEGLKHELLILPYAATPEFWSYLWGFETLHCVPTADWREGFGVTYEGLKLKFYSGNVPGRSVFWSYLWGFETQPVPPDSARHAPSFGVTYEGLKPEPDHGWCIHQMKGFGVTYEGLKHGIMKPKKKKPLVLELPMRVWNWAFPYDDRVAYHRFGVTYEGLKLKFVTTFCRYFDGFGVTYEGLKLAVDYGNRFVCLEVLELPMRVWNFHGSTAEEWPAGVFWSYLWGFETNCTIE